MISLTELLAVQKLDTQVDQLAHKRETLEDLTNKRNAEARLAEANAALAELSAQLKVITSEQKEAEDHASLLEDKAAAVNTALYDGSVTSHKELESLQAEMAQLKSNQNDFEERALASMEQAEPVAESIEAQKAVIAGIVAEIGEIGERIAVSEAEIDARLDEIAGQRQSAVAEVDDDLLELYGKLRRLPGGIAIAAVVGGSCGGCHLGIPSAELEMIRHATDVKSAVCPECGCLLVA